MTTGISPTVFEKMANNWVQQQMAQLTAQAGSPVDLINLAMQRPSTGAYDAYAWLGDVPTVKEWIGEKKARGLKDYGFTIRNKPFYDAIKIDRNDLRDDQTGAHEIRIRDLVSRMAQYRRKLISDLASTGTSALAYDGVAFFANAGAVRKNDNLLAGTGSTLAELKADLIAAIVAMAKAQDEDGEPLNIIPDTILCPIEQMLDFKVVVNSPTDVAGSNPNIRNPFADYGFTVIGDARLSATDVNDWYLFSTKGMLKPFVLQEREAMRSVLDDTKVKSERMYYYSVEWDGNAGYGLPLLASKTVNS